MNGAAEKRLSVFLTGGTGFVGRHVARRLAERGHAIRALVRSSSGDDALRELGAELVTGDLTGALSADVIDGCDTVIHLVGIIKEKPPNVTFEAVHTRGTRRILEAAERAGVSKFVHMSALGAESRQTAYQRTKHEAEDLVRRSEIPFVIFRPSIIVGPEGEFTQLLVRLVRHAPVLPVIGDGSYRLQPVDVEDVANVFVQAAERADLGGASYDIGGPHKLTYDRLLEIVCEEFEVRRKLLHVPVSLVRPFVEVATNWHLPSPLTSDQLEMLMQESIVSGEGNAIREIFGFEPSTFRSAIQRARQA